MVEAKLESDVDVGISPQIASIYHPSFKILISL
jgi:hypothetical protein